MKPADRPHLHALISALVDGTITESQGAELAWMLESDEAARRFYIRYVDMNAALSGASRLPSSVSGSRLSWPAIAATVAAVSVLAASLLIAWTALPVRQQGPASDPTPSERSVQDVAAPSYVATIVSASGDALLNGRPIPTGMRLVPGRYSVPTGRVTLQFDGGASVFFENQPSFTLRSRRAMLVHCGTFVFEADQSCESIEIVTPHSVYRNIGTRYAAVIDDLGEELHVAEGAVRRTCGLQADTGGHELIEAGAGMRYAAGSGARESIPLDSALVARSLETVSGAAADDRPVVFDDFRGDGQQITKLRSGTGWSEAWRSRQGDWQFITPGLAGDGSVSIRHDGAGKPPAERRSAAHRSISDPIDLSRDGIWYVRFLVRRGPQKGRDEHRATVSLRMHGQTPEQEVEQGSLIQIALRKDDAALVRIGNTLTRASLPQTPSKAYAVVAKIVAGSVNPEQVLVRLMAADRLAGSEEPTEWSMVSDSVATNLVIDQISLECVSSSWIEFGDVCIGPTWESVTRPAKQQ